MIDGSKPKAGAKDMSATHTIPVGATSERSVIVTHDLTIAAVSDRLPSLFSTPSMINFMEMTAAQAIKPYLPDGWISVGVLVNVRHLTATPESATVRVTARVTDVDDRRITFVVEAFDEVERIGQGTHVRALVEQSRILQLIEKKTRGLGQPSSSQTSGNEEAGIRN